MSEKIDSSDSCIIVDMIDNSHVYNTDTAHTSLSSHSTVGMQKPVQVVPPTPVVRQVASPAVVPPSSQVPPAAPPPSTVNFSTVPGQPLLQQNVNIMNINLPTASSQPSTSTTALSATPSNSTQAATLIQLPDGRLLLQQAAPTFAFVSGPVQGVSGGGQSFAITMPSGGTVSGGCQHQSAVHIVQQPVTQPATHSVTQPVVQQHQQIVQSSPVNTATNSCSHVTSSVAVGARNSTQRSRTFIQSGNQTQQSSNVVAAPRYATRPPTIVSAPSAPSASVSATAMSSVNRPANRVIQTSTGMVQLPGSMPPDELKRKIELQITKIRSMPNPGPKEKLMLQRLNDLIEQLSAQSSPTLTQESNPASPSTSVQTVPKVASPVPESDNLLADAQYLLMKPHPNEVTLLVEFRVPGQRFMMRLTKMQKLELESILAKTNSDIHHKVLSAVQEKLAAPSSVAPIQSNQTSRPALSSSTRMRKTPPQASTTQPAPVTVMSRNQPNQRLQPQTVNRTVAGQARSPARPNQQQVVLTPQMRRSLQIRRQLQTEQQKAACPTTTEPFKLVKEAAIALMKYHVYQDTDNSSHAASEVDAMLDEAADLLKKRQRHLLAAVRRMERRCLSQNGSAPIAAEEGGPNAEEAYVITNMALDLERDTLEEERKRFQERPLSFQPLDFDLRTGKATAVPLMPPPIDEFEEEMKMEVKEENGEDSEVEEKSDVWESFLESEKLGQVSEPLAKRPCLPEESETDRAVAAIMGETGLSSWSSRSPIVHSVDPDVDAAIRSIM